MWWEALDGRGRMLFGTPAALVVLFGFHEAFFPLLDWQRSLTYAVMEAVPVALLVAWATQNELRRRAAADHAAAERPDAPVADRADEPAATGRPVAERAAEPADAPDHMQ